MQKHAPTDGNDTPAVHTDAQVYVPGRPPTTRIGAVTLTFRPSTPTGYRVGVTHHNVMHDDLTVCACRERHAAGESVRSVARTTGISRRTVRGWLSGRSRSTPPSRVIVTRSMQHTAAASVSNAELARLRRELQGKPTPEPTAAVVRSGEPAEQRSASNTHESKP